MKILTCLILVLLTACSHQNEQASFSWWETPKRGIASVLDFFAPKNDLDNELQEIEATLKAAIDGVAPGVSFRPNLKKVGMSNPNSENFQNIVNKLLKVKLDLITVTSQTPIGSKDRKKILNTIYSYVSAYYNIYGIYAKMAQVSNHPENFDWSHLAHLHPIFNKDYFLEVKEIIHYPARHITYSQYVSGDLLKTWGVSPVFEKIDQDFNLIKKNVDPGSPNSDRVLSELTPEKSKKYYFADLVQIAISSEEMAMIEYLALSAPASTADYAKLIQFTTVRENLINYWATSRLTTTGALSGTLAVNQCVPGALSFKPSFARSGQGNIFSGIYSNELWRFDLYRNVILNAVIDATKTVKDISLASVATNGGALEAQVNFYNNLIFDVYTAKDRPQPMKNFTTANVGWDYTQDLEEYRDILKSEATGSLTLSREESIFAANALNLTESVLDYDALDAKSIARKVAHDIYFWRANAAFENIGFAVAYDEKSSEHREMRQRITRYLHQRLYSLQEKWITKVAGLIEIELNKKLNINNILAKKQSDRLIKLRAVTSNNQLLKAKYVQNFLSGSWIQETKRIPLKAVEYVSNGFATKTDKELLKDGWSSVAANDRLRIIDVDTLIEVFTRDAFSIIQGGLGLSIQTNPAYSALVRSFFADVRNSFEISIKQYSEDMIEKKYDGNLNHSELSSKLWKSLQQIAFAYYAKYPFTQLQFMNFQIANTDGGPFEEFVKAKKNSARGDLTNIAWGKSREVVVGVNQLSDKSYDSYKNKLSDLKLEDEMAYQGQPNSIKGLSQFSDNYKPEKLSDKLKEHFEVSSVTYNPSATWLRKTPNQVMYELFVSLGLREKLLRDKTLDPDIGSERTNKVQRFLAQKYLNLGYMDDPFLSLRLDPQNPKSTLLEVMSKEKYIPGKLQQSALKITDWQNYISRAKGSLQNALPSLATLKQLCEADSAKFGSDQRYENVYNQTEHIREALLGSATQEEERASLQELDKTLYKKVKPFDYYMQTFIEPIVGFIGMTLLIVAVIGSGGIALPAVVTVQSVLIAAGIQAPFIAMGLYRVNYHVFERPPQLMASYNFISASKSLNNEMSFGKRIKVQSYEDTDKKFSANTRDAWISVASSLLFDGYAGFSIVRDMRKLIGIPQAKFAREVLRLGGFKVGFKGPAYIDPLSTYMNQQNKLKGLVTWINDAKRSQLTRIPLFQSINPTELQRAPALSMFRKFEELAKNDEMVKNFSHYENGMDPMTAVFQQFLKEFNMTIDALSFKHLNESKSLKKVVAQMEKLSLEYKAKTLSGDEYIVQLRREYENIQVNMDEWVDVVELKKVLSKDNTKGLDDFVDKWKAIEIVASGSNSKKMIKAGQQVSDVASWRKIREANEKTLKFLEEGRGLTPVVSSANPSGLSRVEEAFQGWIYYNEQVGSANTLYGLIARQSMWQMMIADPLLGKGLNYYPKVIDHVRDYVRQGMELRDLTKSSTKNIKAVIKK